MPEEGDADWDESVAWDQAAAERGVQVAEVYCHDQRRRLVYFFPDEKFRCARSPQFNTLARQIFELDETPTDADIRRLCEKLATARHKRRGDH